AIDEATSRVVVWSAFDRVLDVVSLEEYAVPALHDPDATPEASPGVARLALSRRASTAAPADLDLGRRLFHAASDPRIAVDGRACASCHPDGRDDAIVWATPDGPRQTPMLAGRVTGTAPYGWTGNGGDVK